MASVADGNERLVEHLRARGDALSRAAADEIERLLCIWECNNQILDDLLDGHILVQVSDLHGIQSS